MGQNVSDHHERLEPLSLERSLMVDHDQNVLVSDTILLRVAMYLGIVDLCRCARVCKTWRRVTYGDSCWLRHALDMGLEVRQNAGSVRMLVAEAFLSGAAKIENVLAPTEALRVLSGAHIDDNAIKIAVLSSLRPNNRGVGKTKLLERFLVGEYSGTYEPTVEVRFRKAIDVDGVSVPVEILDVGSSLELKSLQEACIGECDVFVICDNFDNESALLHLDALIDVIFRLKNGKVPIVVVCTKSDISHLCKPVAHLLKPWVKKHNAAFVSTSAKTGKNCSEPFVFGVRMYFSMKSSQNRRSRGLSNLLSTTPTDASGTDQKSGRRKSIISSGKDRLSLLFSSNNN